MATIEFFKAIERHDLNYVKDAIRKNKSIVDDTVHVMSGELCSSLTITIRFGSIETTKEIIKNVNDVNFAVFKTKISSYRILTSGLLFGSVSSLEFFIILNEMIKYGLNLFQGTFNDKDIDILNSFNNNKLFSHFIKNNKIKFEDLTEFNKKEYLKYIEDCTKNNLLIINALTNPGLKKIERNKKGQFLPKEERKIITIRPQVLPTSIVKNIIDFL